MSDPNYDLTRWFPPLSAGGCRGRTGRSASGFAVLAVVLLLLVPLVAGGCGMSTSGGGSTTTAATGAGAATATTSTSTAPTAATATATAPAAPTTPPTATPTPLPPLQAQILTDGLGSPIAAGTNSPIHDVTCPAGYLVAGGGIRSGYANFTVMSSAPVSTTTWEGEVFNTSASAMPYQYVYATCLKRS